MRSARPAIGNALFAPTQSFNPRAPREKRATAEHSLLVCEIAVSIHARLVRSARLFGRVVDGIDNLFQSTRAS